MKIDGIEVVTGDRIYIPLPCHLQCLPWYKRALVRVGLMKPPPNGIYKVTSITE
jgi:hypothetical protein